MAQGGTHGAWGNLATPEVLGVVVLSVLAPLAMLYANQRFKAFAYALFSYLQIPIALLGAWFFLGEDIQGLTGIGLGLVVLGSLASQLPEKRR